MVLTLLTVTHTYKESTFFQFLRSFDFPAMRTASIALQSFPFNCSIMLRTSLYLRFHSVNIDTRLPASKSCLKESNKRFLKFPLLPQMMNVQNCYWIISRRGFACSSCFIIIIIQRHNIIVVCFLNPLRANPTKWTNALTQFVGNSRQIVWVCLTILWGWRLKR